MPFQGYVFRNTGGGEMSRVFDVSGFLVCLVGWEVSTTALLWCYLSSKQIADGTHSYTPWDGTNPHALFCTCCMGC